MFAFEGEVVPKQFQLSMKKTDCSSHLNLLPDKNVFQNVTAAAAREGLFLSEGVVLAAKNNPIISGSILHCKRHCTF